MIWNSQSPDMNEQEKTIKMQSEVAEASDY